MAATYRLKGIGWFAGCVVVTLGFYLVSLQVAAERKRLEQVDAKIRVAERDIRALETEFDTRANLAQLERWNGDTLALVAPGASQFVRGEAQLASVRFDGAQAADIRTAALVVPAYTALSAPASASATAPALGGTVSVPVPAAPARAVVAIAAATSSAGPRVVFRPEAPRATAKADVAPTRKAQAVAMLDRTLLSDTTLGDLVSRARSEAGRGR